MTATSVVLESGGGSITFQDGTTQSTAVGATTNLVIAPLLTSVTAPSSGFSVTLFSETDLPGYTLALMTGTINFLYSNCTITNVQIKVIQVDTIIFNYIQSSQLTATTVALYNSTPFSVSYIPIAGAITQVQVLLTYTGTSPNIQFLGTSTSSIPTIIQLAYFG
jgi:hypothetical protein